MAPMEAQQRQTKRARTKENVIMNKTLVLVHERFFRARMTFSHSLMMTDGALKLYYASTLL